MHWTIQPLREFTACFAANTGNQLFFTPAELHMRVLRLAYQKTVCRYLCIPKSRDDCGGLTYLSGA